MNHLTTYNENKLCSIFLLFVTNTQKHMYIYLYNIIIAEVVVIIKVVVAIVTLNIVQNTSFSKQFPIKQSWARRTPPARGGGRLPSPSHPHFGRILFAALHVVHRPENCCRLYRRLILQAHNKNHTFSVRQKMYKFSSSNLIKRFHHTKIKMPIFPLKVVHKNEFQQTNPTRSNKNTI